MCYVSPVWSMGRFMAVLWVIQETVFSLYKGLPRLGTPAILPAGSTEGKRPYFSRFLPNRPRTLKSFDTHTRWQPVTQSVDLDDLTQKRTVNSLANMPLCFSSPPPYSYPRRPPPRYTWKPRWPRKLSRWSHEKIGYCEKSNVRSSLRYYGKPNVAIFNSFNFICSFVLCVQLCV